MGLLMGSLLMRLLVELLAHGAPRSPLGGYGLWGLLMGSSLMRLLVGLLAHGDPHWLLAHADRKKKKPMILWVCVCTRSEKDRKRVVKPIV